VFGVRCGSAIQGYETPSRGKTIQKVEWPKAKKKNAFCTLKELMQENKINKQTDTLVFHMPVTYCAHFTKVDSKNFGVPQTRQRTYMFVWQPSVDSKGNAIDEDLGKYWEAVVKHLQSPVRRSLEAFILQVDHDIIRVFREG
jgi:site-specific DNA-cytosine methylase